MYKLSIILSILLLTACARKVHTEKSITTATKDSSYHSVDTSKMVVKVKVTEVTNYGGDSLQGSLYFPVVDSIMPLFSDSLESNGIKVKVSIQAQKGGGFKANVQANAKPKSTNKTTEINTSGQKGIAASGEVASDTKTKTKAKQTESEGFPWDLIIWGIIALLSALFLIYKFVK